MAFRNYILKRMVLFVIVILGVVTVTFLLSHVIPADPVAAILGENAPADLVKKTERQLGLDLPLHQQYIRYLGSACCSSRPFIIIWGSSPREAGFPPALSPRPR